MKRKRQGRRQTFDAATRRKVYESGRRYAFGWDIRRPQKRQKEADMPSFNKVILMGNLTRDPQLKHLPSNVVVAEFGLACNRRYRTAAGEDKEDVVFVDCTAFARQAETIGQYCTKGKPLFVEGRLKYDSWEDKQGGGKRSKVTVVVENFQFISDKGAAEFPQDMQAEQPRQQQSRRPAPSQRPQQQVQPTAEELDDVPF